MAADNPRVLSALHIDEFERVYPGRLQQHHGFRRPVIREAVREYLRCGMRFPGWLLVLALGPCASLSVGEDWPTYMHDNARSGRTSEHLELPLSPLWVYRPRRPPQCAWPAPARDYPHRVAYDHAFQAVMTEGAVFFGSSADNKVHCLDAETGGERWSAFTSAPVRLAPTVFEGRVLAGSDDGWVYCFDAETGGCLWKRRGAPSDRCVLGAGRMMSPWPVRTGVLVERGLAYFAAGLFPAEGVHLYAVRADSGEVVWENDTCGQMFVDLPHKWAEGLDGLSPQGFLLASAHRLYVPTGRSVPAAFDIRDGKFLFWRSGTKYAGGVTSRLHGEWLINGTARMTAYDARTGESRFPFFPGGGLIVTDETAYALSKTEIVATDQSTYPALSRKEFDARAAIHHAKMWRRNYAGTIAARQKRRRETGVTEPSAEELKMAEEIVKLGKQLEAGETSLKEATEAMPNSIRWRTACSGGGGLIMAGGTLYAGSANEVSAVDAATGKRLWTAPVDGTAYGLAVAGGRLVVSTDTGAIHCFGSTAKARKPPPAVERATVAQPYATDDLTPVYARAAERIIKETGVTRGYCLALGCGEGRLAYELVKRSELVVYGIDDDVAAVERGREALDEAGLHGARITLQHGARDHLPYANYFANLIVSDRVLTTGRPYGPAAELFRVLKPCGGIVYVGQPAEMPETLATLDGAVLKEWLAGLVADVTDDGDGVWARLRRGTLPGGGAWTHQYGDAANTGNSGDQRVRPPFGVLWFGRPGPAKMLDHHLQGPAPLAVGGRMFVQGHERMMAVDSYNGVLLWERQLPGARRTYLTFQAGNLAASRESLFVATGSKCLRLDPATGRTLAAYPVAAAADGKERYWGYVAFSAGRLIGTGSPGLGRCNSHCIFSLAPDTGQVQWVRPASHIPHSAVAVGAGKVFFIEREQALLSGAPRRPENLLALDATTGKVCWQKSVVPPDFKESARRRSLIHTDGKLLVHWGYGPEGLMAVADDDGGALWAAGYGDRRRPVVIGHTVYWEPWALDTRTGKPLKTANPITGRLKPWRMTRAYGCGNISGAPNCLFFRSGTVGFYDLQADRGVSNWGGMRPGCYLNVISADGLVLAPEGSAFCRCSYPIQTTVVLEPTTRHEDWSVFVAYGPLVPVERLALNLGAPGDKRASDGALWFGYPRPKGQVLKPMELEVAEQVYPDMGYYRRNSDRVAIRNTDRPWIYASGCRGLKRFDLMLVGENDKPRLYSVRLGFADPDNDRAGVRAFDIGLQGKLVRRAFDIVEAAGGRDRCVVGTFEGIEVRGRLVIELTSSFREPSSRQAPVISSIELIHQPRVARGE